MEHVATVQSKSAQSKSARTVRDTLRKKGSTAKSGGSASSRPSKEEHTINSIAEGSSSTSVLHALRQSAANGDVDDAKRLIERLRADVDQLRMSQATGASPEATDEARVAEKLDRGHSILGTNALHRACMYGQVKVAKMLLDAGAAIDCRDRGGRTPLMLACHNGHMEMINMLLTRDAQLDANADNGWNVTMYAASGGHVRVLRQLASLDEGLDAEESESGETALDVAIRHDKGEATAFLRECQWKRRVKTEEEAAAAQAEIQMAASLAGGAGLGGRRGSLRAQLAMAAEEASASSPAPPAEAARKPRRMSMAVTSSSPDMGAGPTPSASLSLDQRLVSC